MSILENIERRANNTLSPIERGFAVQIERLPPNCGDYGVARQYEQRILATVRYFVDERIKDDDMPHTLAKEQLLRFIFDDVYVSLREMRAAAYAGDYRKSLALIDDLERALRP